MTDIKVLIIEPGEKPRVDWIANTLYALQEVVGGYIETVTIAEDAVVVCNEEGRLLGLSDNCSICGVDFCGTVFICGVDGEDFCDVPDWVCSEEGLVHRDD